jgi:hypothetical protein
MSEAADLSGRRFGWLTVLRRDWRKDCWACRCACDKEVIFRGIRLREGSARSCGCLRSEILRIKSNTVPEPDLPDESRATVWGGMIDRCYNPNNVSWAYYGGRGIRVCDEWRHSVAAFIRDVGPRPSMEHSIDRIDNDGNYEPGNVRWATRKQQGRNRSNNVIVEYQDERRCIGEWAELLNVRASGLNRLWRVRPGDVIAAIHRMRSKTA